MPSPRRKRFILLALILLALTILYLATGSSSTKSSPFYLSTLSSLESSKSGTGIPSKFAPRPGADVGRQELEYLRSRKAETAAQEEAEAADATDKLKERLREAEVLAKKNADSKWKHAAADVPAGKKGDIPRKGSKDIWALAAQAAIQVGVREAEEKKKQQDAEAKWSWGKGKEGEKIPEKEKAAEKDKEKGVAGRRKYPAPADQAAAAEDGIAHVGPQVDTAKGLGKPDSDTTSGDKEDEKPTDEDTSLTFAKAELTHLISTHPLLIFSKSYCPHSLRAKRILTEHHTITPPPHIVELDQHDLGREIQGLLAEMTGRRTVPNVVVGGESIGGGDEMQRLWEEGRVGEVLKGKVEGVVVVDEAPGRE